MIMPDLEPDEPCEVVDAECETVVRCKNSALARVVAAALNKLSDEEIEAVSGCKAPHDEMRRLSSKG